MCPHGPMGVTRSAGWGKVAAFVGEDFVGRAVRSLAFWATVSVGWKMENPMATFSSQSRPIAVWMKMLDDIDQALAESLARAVEQPVSPAVTDENIGAALQAMRRLDERLANLQARLDRAAVGAAGTDAALAGQAAVLDNWQRKSQLLSYGLVGVRETS